MSAKENKERIVMATIVAGEMYEKLDGQLFEIKRQMRQPNGYPHDPEVLSRGLQQLIEGNFGTQPVVEVMQTAKPQPLILTGTGNTLADWLKAREKMHEFLTGEKVNFLDMFVVDDKTLTRTDIMPFFRPAGATNRMALDWKVKLGMNPSYEEVDVMKYRNAGGLNAPQLGFMKRSIRPDEETLGKHAMSPDGLIETRKTWVNLFGYSDADSLHFLITGEHLDSGETLTWFPDDRLPGGREVAHGDWGVHDAQANFDWNYHGYCHPFIGARLAELFPFKKS